MTNQNSFRCYIVLKNQITEPELTQTVEQIKNITAQDPKMLPHLGLAVVEIQDSMVESLNQLEHISSLKLAQ